MAGFSVGESKTNAAQVAQAAQQKQALCSSLKGKVVNETPVWQDTGMCEARQETRIEEHAGIGLHEVVREKVSDRVYTGNVIGDANKPDSFAKTFGLGSILDSVS